MDIGLINDEIGICGLVEVFCDTRNKSLSMYRKNTKRIVNCVYANPTHAIGDPVRYITRVDIEHRNIADVLSEVYCTDGKLAVLNCADVSTIGGLVAKGENGDEETLCRCTNLYEALSSEDALSGFYESNRSCGNLFYTDTVLYTRDVLVFKNIKGGSLVTPFDISVLSCSSPSRVVADKNILRQRISGIIDVAWQNGVTELVIGMWGMDHDEQDPVIVGEVFESVLSCSPYFRRVMFALSDEKIYNDFMYGYKKRYKGVFENVL